MKQQNSSKQPSYIHYKDASKVNPKDEATEKLELEFRPRKAWHTKDGATITENHVPRDIQEIPKLYRGIVAALKSIGATLVSQSRVLSPYRHCERCDKVFTAQRQTARFCQKCRSSYQRRKEIPGYAERNRERAKAGMERIRHPEKYGYTKSQNRKGRRKKARGPIVPSLVSKS